MELFSEDLYNNGTRTVYIYSKILFKLTRPPRPGGREQDPQEALCYFIKVNVKRDKHY